MLGTKSGYRGSWAVASQSKPPKLSRKPKRPMVSSVEKRSADEGIGGGLGKRFDIEGSKVKSNSGKGAGGCSGEVAMIEG